MYKVIISSNPDSLIRFLKQENNAYCYLYLSQDAIDDTFLINKNLKKIAIDEGKGNMDFAKEYIDFIGGLNHSHSSLYWWATTLSYKGTFGSNLCSDIYNYYCTSALIKRQDSNYVILSNSPVFNNCIKNYCAGIGVECRLLDTKKKNGFFSHLRKCLKSTLYFLCQGWTRKALIYIYLSGNIERLLKKSTPYYIVKSWIDKASFLEGDRYHDLFFGRLPEYLKEKNKDFIILAGILKGYKEMVQKIKAVRQYLIIPQEYFVGYMDYIKVLALNLINRPRIAKPVRFCGLDVTDLVRECLRKDYENNEINKNLIYYYYIKGLSRKINIHIFLFPFEGQSWERLSILAIKRHSPSTKSIGYAHASLPPYVLNYFYSKEEGMIVPLPDKIVTVGKETKDILEVSGNYNNKTMLKEGCALRYEYIFKRDRVAWNRNGAILAALSMDIGYSLKLLKLLSDALAGKDNYKVIVRPHPFMPIEMITNGCNLRLAGNFQISKTQRLEDDLTDSTLVVYINTTTSIEALMAGVPVVYADLKEPISLDPLFRLNSLKWVVSDGNELSRVVDYLYHMGNEEYLEKYKKALEYLKEYFYPVEEKYLQEFIT